MKPNIIFLFVTAGATALLAGCSSQPPTVDDGIPNPERGRGKIIQYGCRACHVIPGIPGKETKIGPSMEGFGSREKIAGNLDNTEENVIRWIRNPRSINPRTGMPNMGVSEADARDIAAYLRTLK